MAAANAIVLSPSDSPATGAIQSMVHCSKKNRMTAPTRYIRWTGLFGAFSDWATGYSLRFDDQVAGETGLEPAALRFGDGCSTIELLP